jgi:hypothetical protein
MRVHAPISTKDLTVDDAKALAETVFSIINKDLIKAQII